MSLSDDAVSCIDRLVNANLGTVFAILIELDASVASSRDKGRLIEAVQALARAGRGGA